MRRRLIRLLDSPMGVVTASVVTLVLGLFFAFVRAPHPWGWRGIDQYHELARGLARGEPFGTTDVPWGYAYYVAAWYAAFGEHTWLPVLGQVVLNASVPLLLFLIVRPAVGPRLATLAALLVGLFSFNTIYASTQASDAICTVLSLASLAVFSRGARSSAMGWFAAAGLLAGLVPQFRPNLVLLPLGLAVVYVLLRPPRRRAVLHSTVFLALFTVALLPWIVRNYQLTGAFVPTSTHGAVQLWYGSLQVGPYLENRARNPRTAFEWPAFDYTSLAGTPIVVEADKPGCGDWAASNVALVYWTDRDGERRRVEPGEVPGRVTPPSTLAFTIPGQPSPTAVYYYFEAAWTMAGAAPDRQTTPPGGEQAPLVYLVSDDHLGDLDRHGDLLDVFDVVRLVRHLAWDEALPPHPSLDLDRDGLIGPGDLDMAVTRLLRHGSTTTGGSPLEALDVTTNTAVLLLADGSSLTTRRDRFTRVTDLDVDGEWAGWLVASHGRLAPEAAVTRDEAFDRCQLLVEPRANDVFYRDELHRMRRYSALAFDNISRTPMAFAAASAYRAGRMFIIRGSDEPSATYQFSRSGLIYGAGLILSSAYLLAFLAGAFRAWRRYPGLLILLLPIAYIPLTIAFVLTNMRYTVTVQPLMFAFIAVALAAALRLDEPESERSERSPLI